MPSHGQDIINMQVQCTSSVDYQPDSIANLQRKLKEKDDIIKDLKLCLSRTEDEMKGLQKQVKIGNPISKDTLKAEVSKLFPMLTANQIAIMTKEKKKVVWTVEEVATGFTHSYLGKRGYNFTIHKLGIPLPSIRTLQRWGEKMKVAPGFLDDSFIILKGLSKTYTEAERQVRS